MLDPVLLQANFESTRLAPITDRLIDATQSVLATTRHGDLARWQLAKDTLPDTPALSATLDQAWVTVGDATTLELPAQQTLQGTLREFIPWRKGPFSICGIDIDTEWRSDWKWDRLGNEIKPLQGKRVLDVGCGSGYHAWRMLGAGADVVLGIDPGLLFVMQFGVLQHFIQSPRISVLPLKLEQLPSKLGCFDAVFSMGVIYHRRDPEAHLLALWDALAPGGELICETLVIPTGNEPELVPEDRYARMHNVWHIPTCDTLCTWLNQTGFTGVRVVSEAATTAEEQRSTDWMPFESLTSSLDPTCPNRTVEGYPAPRRAIVIAQRP